MSEFDYKNLVDTRFFAQNRLEAHADFIAYQSQDEILSETSSLRYSLDGIWNFHYGRNLEQRPVGFESLDVDCHNWDKIHVPAHIQMEGYDAPMYVNIQYPWDGHEKVTPGEIPTEFNPVASYVKYFTLPESFQNETVYISLQGVESGYALWLNGHYVGYSEDSFTASEFDLTPYFVPGENKLAIQVYKWVAGSFCEDQDFFVFSGIFRNVYLYKVPSLHLKDLKIETFLDDSYTDATLEVTLKTSGKGSASLVLMDPMSLGITPLEQLQQEAFAFTTNATQIASEEIELEDGLDYIWNIPVAKPTLWSAENPYLYRLMITLKDETGTITEVIPYQVGFRQFEMINHIMCLNGKRIVFKGVNRHEFSSKNGRVPNKEELIQDIVTMKKHNINAIRTCHYPDFYLLYKLCDAYGLYLIAENNMETHGTWDGYLKKAYGEEGIVPGNNEAWLPLLLDRVESCYQNFKNHPAVLIWSCGNESYGGKVIYEMSQKFRALDPNRLVHYEGLFWDRSYNDTSDIESQMYTPALKIEEFFKKDPSKPFICCEYQHAMANSCGAMHYYTDLTDREPLFQGGFIWDYIDQSLTKKDRYGNDFQAYGGDFDDRPCNYNFSGNGVVYGGDRDISPKMQVVKFNYQNIALQVSKTTVTVINKNLFTNTNCFHATVLLEKDGRLIGKYPFATDVEPLSKKTYELPCKEQTKEGEYVITVSLTLKEDTLWANAGHEVAFGQTSYNVAGEQKLPDGLVAFTTGYRAALKAPNLTASLSPNEERPYKVTIGTYNIGVKGENFEVLYSHEQNGIVSYTYCGKEMIKMIPRPNFWRAPIDNDLGYNMPAIYGQWKIASLYASNKKMLPEGGFEIVQADLKEYADHVEITSYYFLPTTPVAECQMIYSIYGDGTIKTTLKYDPMKELGDLPEFGIMFKIDADYDHLEWYGNGPAETYIDRKYGAKLGIYQNKVADNMAKYLNPQECGNKTDVRYAKVMDLRGHGLLLVGDKMNFSALPYTPHELENATHAFELPQIHYTVIRVSNAQLGIAGDDTWGAKPHEEYKISTSTPLEFSFCFRGI